MTTKKYIPASGNPNAKLMILGESPSYQEVDAGRPFVGPSGKELDRLLADAGMSRNGCWISNVCKYFVTPNLPQKKIPFAVRAKNDGIDIHEQLADLQREINAVEPNTILALGGTALWALTGKSSIRNFRGSILLGMGRKTVPTYHPAHLLHTGEIKGYWNRQVMVLDFKRAKRQSEFPEVVLPKRNLSIARNSSQLASFIARHKGYTKPAVDIEAAGLCIPVCIGIAFTPNEGITVPLWNNNDGFRIPVSDMISMWLMLNELLSQHDIIGQNFKYDQDKIRRLGFTVKSLISDTMLKAFTINPELPKALAFNQSIYTEEPFYKDEGMYEGSFEDLLIGCARDACVTKEIDLNTESEIDELGQRDWYNNFIMHLHQFYLDIESEGFCIDREKRDFLFEKYVRWSEQLQYELFRLTEANINVNSPKQVSILLFEVLNLPRRAGTGEEEITALLNNQSSKLDDTKRRVLEIILEKRRVDKTINTYLMALPDYDGKMKTTYFPCLETGRSSTGQLEPPIRPYHDKDTGEITSKKTKVRAIGTAFQTITKHGDIGEDVRSQYVPEKGHIFLQADSAQAEARVVFLLANDEDALYAIDKHDYHALTASWFFGGSEDDYSKRKLGYESPIRFAGKTLRHAGHLGAGKRRAATELNTQARKYKIPISITEAIAERALKIFHMKQPKIRAVFHNEVIEALTRDRRFLTSSVPYGIDSKIGGKRQFFERWGDELFRQGFSYIPQRSISDNTKAAGLRLRKKEPSLRIILECHDSLLFMVPEREVDYFAPMIREELERPIRFDTCSLPRRDLIIPCDIEKGYNYQDMIKHKMDMYQKNIIEPTMVPRTITEEFSI